METDKHPKKEERVPSDVRPFIQRKPSPESKAERIPRRHESRPYVVDEDDPGPSAA